MAGITLDEIAEALKERAAREAAMDEALGGARKLDLDAESDAERRVKAWCEAARTEAGQAVMASGLDRHHLYFAESICELYEGMRMLTKLSLEITEAVARLSKRV